MLLTLFILAALALPAFQPSYSVLAQADGSVVSEQQEEQEPAEPTEVPPPPTEAPPPPTDVPPPPTEVPPPPTDIPTDVPATEPPAPTVTSEVVLPADTEVATSTVTETSTLEATATPYKDLRYGSLVRTTARVNCRIGPSTGEAVVTITANGDQAVVLTDPMQSGGFDWVQVQLLNAETNQCYLAAQYLTLLEQDYPVPATITPTATASNTSTPTETLTPTITNTPTQTPIATPYKNLQVGDRSLRPPV
ncbi:MAG: hypothetical protein M9947_05800 [Thermomicrobiales bacterium]|nr:hypothetical protein [Thermomicrobiales bacterium]